MNTVNASRNYWLSSGLDICDVVHLLPVDQAEAQLRAYAHVPIERKHFRLVESPQTVGNVESLIHTT